MTLVPAARTATTRQHPLIDYATHGVRSFDGSTSTYLPELPFRLLSTLCYHKPNTVVGYAALAAVMWPGAVSEPYDGGYNQVIRNHLSGIKAIMTHDGAWPFCPFEVKYDVGICVVSSLMPVSPR